ncbi:MAG: hypothetical protein HRT88_10055 [Lentisphaeraceae bacterium]|nr:hypothetical protein [Lentisphaeraceae bacterium]
MLINHNSASTTEVFAAGMQTNKSAVIIGQTSAGMALPSIMVSLRDGSLFQYPIADFKTASGKSLEGNGVTPDIKVEHSLESLLAGRDVFIEEAINFIQEQ